MHYAVAVHMPQAMLADQGRRIEIRFESPAELQQFEAAFDIQLVLEQRVAWEPLSGQAPRQTQDADHDLMAYVDAIRQQPEMTHTLNEIVLAVEGRPITARANGKNNPDYRAARERLAHAHQVLAAEGVEFSEDSTRRPKVYQKK